MRLDSRLRWVSSAAIAWAWDQVTGREVELLAAARALTEQDAGHALVEP